ncbi:MAG TPA: hypothetical protein PKD49_15155 [Hyphomicrobium sp.]|nr:hypothetical protein [Hyphomicrobium sp.]
MARPGDSYQPVSRPQWITADGVELVQQQRERAPRPFQFERMLARLPPGVRDSLTHQQLDCISDALIPDPPRHAIDYRASIPFFGRRFYVTLLVGRERRSLERLAREAQLRASHTAIVYSILLLLLICGSFLGFVLLGYVLKSVLGVDLTDGPSMLHFLFYEAP